MLFGKVIQKCLSVITSLNPKILNAYSVVKYFFFLLSIVPYVEYRIFEFRMEIAIDKILVDTFLTKLFKVYILRHSYYYRTNTLMYKLL